MRESLEVSQGGFRLSYNRFLSDTASGILGLGLTFLLYYLDVWGLRSWAGPLLGSIGTQVKIFVLVLLGVFTVPLGLSLNGAGWFLLGWLQICGPNLWIKHARCGLVRSTWSSFHGDELQRVFGLDGQNFHREVRLYREILRAARPDELDGLRHITGLVKLLRSATLLALISCILLVCPHWAIGVLLFVAGLLCVLLISLLEFFVSVRLMFRVYILVLGLAWNPLGEPLTGDEWRIGELFRRLSKAGT